MRSWWQLGEGTGQLGNQLALYRIECAFCSERGHWKPQNSVEKKQPKQTFLLIHLV